MRAFSPIHAFSTLDEIAVFTEIGKPAWQQTDRIQG
jgi:hypothetical protein